MIEIIRPSSIEPDTELCEFLKGEGVKVVSASGSEQQVAIYSDWERPTNNLPTDFIVVFINGDIGGVGMDTNYAEGYLIVSLYCKMNDDGSVKANRIKKILAQIDNLVEKRLTENYYFEYDAPRFITPTTPNQTSGYSVTSLNLKWHTRNNFNTE